MRLFNVLMISSLLVACRRPIEVSGTYLDGDRGGVFFPCDQLNTRWLVRDSTLAARSRLQSALDPSPLFVRLRGVRSDSGSVYGGSHFLLVRQIIETRAPRIGECANVPGTLRLGRP